MANDTIKQDPTNLQEGLAILKANLDELEILLVKVNDKVRRSMHGQSQEVGNILAEFNINLDFQRVQLMKAVESLEDKQKQETSETEIVDCKDVQG